jgi:hypothetical protein
VRRGGDRVKRGEDWAIGDDAPNPTDPGDLPVTRYGRRLEVMWAFDGPGVKKGFRGKGWACDGPKVKEGGG